MPQNCTCPQGMNLVEINEIPFCEYIDSVAPSCSPRTCPEGYTYSTELSLCVIHHTTNNLCPNGLVYNSSAHTCTEVIQYAASCSCSANVTAQSHSICGGQTTAINLTSTTTGVVYSWIVTQVNVTGASSGSGSLSTIAQVLNTTNGGTAIYTITPYEVGGCAGQSIQVVVEVNAIPSIVATPSTPQTIATGSSVGISLSSSVVSSTFTWTVTSPSTITGATAGSGAIIENTLLATTTGAVTYHIVATSPNGCTNTLNYVVNVTSVPSCPNRRVVFQICNSNAVRDDNFNIFLNGTYIGAVDLNHDSLVGSVFIADLNPSLTITGSDFICPISSMTVYRFNPNILQTTNTITMVNTQDNGAGNFGSIGIRNYTLSGSSLSAPCVIADPEYNPAGGQDAIIYFNYTGCCSGDTPT